MISIFLNKLIIALTFIVMSISFSSCINHKNANEYDSVHTTASEEKSVSSEAKRDIVSQSEPGENKFETQRNNSSQSLTGNFAFSSPEEIESWRKLRVSGDEARNTGNHQQAVQDYTYALAIRPEHKTYFNRAISFTELGQLEDALTDYDKSLELQQDFYEGWYNRGTLLDQMKRHQDAISSYEKVISLKPDYFAAWYNRGYSQACLTRYEDAILSNEKALSINPELHLAWHAHGINLIGLGRNKDAIASFQKSLKIDPDNQVYRRNLEVVTSNFNTRIQVRPCSLTIFE